MLLKILSIPNLKTDEETDGETDGEFAKKKNFFFAI